MAFAGAISFSVAGFMTRSPETPGRLDPNVAMALHMVPAAVCDCLISASLTWVLVVREREIGEPSARMSALVVKLVHLALQTAASTAVVAVVGSASEVLFVESRLTDRGWRSTAALALSASDISDQSTSLHRFIAYPFVIILPSLYCLSLLVVVRSRDEFNTTDCEADVSLQMLRLPLTANPGRRWTRHYSRDSTPSMPAYPPPTMDVRAVVVKLEDHMLAEEAWKVCFLPPFSSSLDLPLTASGRPNDEAREQHR